MQEELKRIESEILEKLRRAETMSEIEEIRVAYLGRKGVLTTLLKGVADLPPDQKPVIGKLSNEIRNRINAEMEIARNRIAAADRLRRLAEETIDISLPGRPLSLGHKHPITQTWERIREIFTGMGFQPVEGPEIESEYYNFDALNTPRHHPARDMQDTFYITDSVLLRTQTSPMQIRYMEKHQPPIRIIVPGKVYRHDDDVSHSPMFHQVEGLMVDKRVTFAELKGVLTSFAHQMFGPETKIRLRPSFFPFTEPSAEVDISCIICEGKGCRACKDTGWMEVLGSGSVDPEVFRAVGYDPEEVTGFAFGLGIDRIAMLRYRINDIRLLFNSDMRFLTQF